MHVEPSEGVLPLVLANIKRMGDGFLASRHDDKVLLHYWILENKH